MLVLVSMSNVKGADQVGSGILSFMSAQAGAKHVVALEASSMAEKMAIVSYRVRCSR